MIKQIRPELVGIARRPIEIRLIDDIEMFNVLRKCFPKVKYANAKNFKDRGVKYSCEEHELELKVSLDSLIDITAMCAIPFINELMEKITDELLELAIDGYQITHFYQITGYQKLRGEKFSRDVYFKVDGVFKRT